MCGIAGLFKLNNSPVQNITNSLGVMNELIAHRGPDGEGSWINENRRVGLTHRRLSIIDLSENAAQPMFGEDHLVIVFNGEIYNYKELRQSLKYSWNFRSDSDTECILAAYNKYGKECLQYLRGMFSIAIWDKRENKLFCARDRFGIKPFYYLQNKDTFYFASEAKALVPFLNSIETNSKALSEYLTFQYTIGEETLFQGVKNLLPGHMMEVSDNGIHISQYWNVDYDIDFDHSFDYHVKNVRELVNDSLSFHMRSDVPVGSYISGGIDSSLLHTLASQISSENNLGFHGRFTTEKGYDESEYALAVTEKSGGHLDIIDITSNDFLNNINDIIYHLDFPVAGPGSFPQYMVSKLAAEKVKVVIGGQGGDEIFGGYARYLIAYLEQCLKASIDGTYLNGKNYVVTIESIIPNLTNLAEYKPLIKEFWREGLFDPLDQRYFRIINRSNDMVNEINWENIDLKGVFENFLNIFNGKNVGKEAYFDKMTHFDFKCLLPALLQVEDRMSMAHGLESRVPLLDHPLVEYVAKIPADVKFKDGKMKHLLKTAFPNELPEKVLNRRDKMGFPVPLKEWFSADLKEFVIDTFNSSKTQNRTIFNKENIINEFGKETRFSRKTWGLLSLELWHQQFHDKHKSFQNMLKAEA